MECFIGSILMSGIVLGGSTGPVVRSCYVELQFLGPKELVVVMAITKMKFWNNPNPEDETGCNSIGSGVEMCKEDINVIDLTRADYLFFAFWTS